MEQMCYKVTVENAETETLIFHNKILNFGILQIWNIWGNKLQPKSQVVVHNRQNIFWFYVTICPKTVSVTRWLDPFFKCLDI